MKRILVMLVLAVCLAATVASAKMVTVTEIYTVKEGDTLFSIAKEFGVAEHDIVQSNSWVTSLKREYWDGRKLTLLVKKDVSDTLASTKKSGKLIWKWQNVGAKPFGSRDIRKAIGMFSVPNKVKIGWFAAIQKGEFKPHRINIGDRFKQMISGSYKLYGNHGKHGDVVADFVDPYKDGLNADLYQFDYDGQRWFLVKPYVCMNWSWWAEDILAPKEELATAEVRRQEQVEKKTDIPQEEIVSEKVAVEDRWEKAKEKVAPEKIFERAAESSVARFPAISKSVSSVYRPYIDMTAFGGLSKRVVKIGNGDYYGGNFTGYPIKAGIFDLGINANYVQWRGYNYDEVAVVNQNWVGNKLSYGAAIKANFKSSNVSLKFGQITRNSQFENSAGYKNKERSDGLYFTLAPTWILEDRFFHMVELSGTYELYNAGKKESWQNNVAISPANDPWVSSSELYISWKTEFYRFNDNLAWMVGASYWDNKVDSSVTVFTGPKVKLGYFELTVTGGHESFRTQPGNWKGDASLNFYY